MQIGVPVEMVTKKIRGDGNQEQLLWHIATKPVA